MRITHAFDADLDLYLVSPGARFVELSTDIGGKANDYGTGTGCDGAFTMSGLKGARAKGKWQLLVNDDDATVVGALNCWELTISSRAKKK